MSNVAVLMSTYNGEKYLREQIESILSQERVDVFLYIRDDGSSDNTINIIKEYERKNKNIKLFEGKNVGVGCSFMQLIYDVPDNYDFYSFADQDDVWLPEKLYKATEKIKGLDSPALYCSNQILVDKDLNKLGMRFNSAPDYSYKQIICRNQLTGCTMVLNQSLKSLLENPDRRPTVQLIKNRIHDVWVAMVAAMVGEIVFDQDSQILYRQHESNVVGVRKVSLISEWKRKINNPDERNGRSTLCKEIFDNYGDLIKSTSVIEDIKMYGFYISDKSYKRKLLRDRSLIKYSKESGFLFAVKVLLNLL